MNFLAGQQATPAEKQLRPLLFDEAIHVLSTFELNQMASLTYNDVTCDDMFELIERICSKPLEHTPLSIQKALVVTKHILIYGQEKTVNHAYGLQDYFKALTTFNTVLMTQKQGGAMAFFQSIQGGGVDKGGPVRQAAEDVVKMLSNVHELQRIRNASASQESLVPVGDDKVAFVTDEVRHHILKQRIAKERQIQIKSNLAKAENGFGAGYSASDGRSVVGAAHGIEEMIKMAKIQKKSFSDDDSRPPGYKTEEERILEELQAEAEAAKAATQAAATPEADLLGFSYPSSQPAKEVDLLGFGDDTTATTTPSPAPYPSQLGDLLGGVVQGYSTTQPSPDPFALGPISSSISSAPSATSTIHSLANGAIAPASVADPFAELGGPPINNVSLPMAMHSAASDVNALVSGLGTLGLGAPSLQPKHPPPMASSADRFAALDDLAATNPPSATVYNASTAEANILANGSTNLNSGLNSLYSTPNPADLYSSSAMPYGMAFGMPPAPPPPVPDNMVTPGSGHVAKSYGDVGENVEDNPWVMGGIAGTGLEPVVPAPGSAPPPPPQTF